MFVGMGSEDSMFVEEESKTAVVDGKKRVVVAVVGMVVDMDTCLREALAYRVVRWPLYGLQFNFLVKILGDAIVCDGVG
jgi:hypothetical protein